jgi:hypothetical protein
LDTLLSTPSGVTSPTTVTFFAAKSMSNDVTPEVREQFGYQSQRKRLFLFWNTQKSCVSVYL